MIILSIDCGFEKVGYSIFDKNKRLATGLSYVNSGLITTSKSNTLEKRFEIIHQSLSNIVLKYKPTLIILEQLFFFKNQKTVIGVAQAQGVILLLASQKNIPVEFLTPLQIKQIVTGYGNADKKSVQKMLKLLLGNKAVFKTDDEADAVACGLAYCYLNK